jgi:hypothetical protein
VVHPEYTGAIDCDVLSLANIRKTAGTLQGNWKIDNILNFPDQENCKCANRRHRGYFLWENSESTHGLPNGNITGTL